MNTSSQISEPTPLPQSYVESLTELVSHLRTIRTSHADSTAPPPPALVIVELFNRSLGVAWAARGFLSRIPLNPDCSLLPVELVACDPELILSTNHRSTKKRRPAKRADVAFITKLISGWIGLVEPTFLIFEKYVHRSITDAQSIVRTDESLASYQLVSIVEGIDLPQIEAAIRHRCALYETKASASDGHSLLVPTIEHVTSDDESEGPKSSCRPLPMTRREASRLIFKIQCAWRRRMQRKRIGVYVDGRFLTHEEAKQLERKRAAEEQRLVEETLRRHRSALAIQRVYRGHAGRKVAYSQRILVRNTPKLKAMLARRKIKRGNIYNTDTFLPAAFEHKFRLLVRWLIFRGFLGRGGVGRGRGSDEVPSENSSSRSCPLTAEERLLIQRKLRNPL